jgi:CRP-like cAMP-binding protein
MRYLPVPHSKNQLLAQLDGTSMDRIRPFLRTVELEPDRVLAEVHQAVDSVCFPHSGILSCVVDLDDGVAIETAMIGADGQYGAGPVLDDRHAMNRVVVQIPGTASVIDGEDLRPLVEDVPAIRKLLTDYEQFFIAQVQQTAACNACHDIERRMSNWLLRMHDLAGDRLMLTQEFMAQMMGVRRTSISGVAALMQKKGLISYSRGHLHLTDVGKLEANCCECHAALKAHHEAIFGRRNTVPAM